MAEVKEGDVLAGKYRVERILGEGGMGYVVAATHISLEERVALKFMRAEAMSREDGVQRFLREARAAVKLKSEHVTRVLDVGTLESGAPYIVMEYLEGQDLSHVLGARGALPLAEAVDYVLQASDAVAEAHARGIIHRDLKPANIFVTRGRDGAPLVKVLDFGISKVNVLGDRPESVTSSATLLGSPVYMSPEQMKSSRDVRVTADIWSIGIILYEAVGGRVPFDEQTMGALMAKVLTEPPPSLATLRPDLPEGFLDVVGRCLEKDPAQRWQEIGELAAALAPFGPPGAEERVARITSMRPHKSSDAPTSMVGSSPYPLAHPSILGVATTQAGPVSGDLSGSVPGPRSRAGLYAAIGAGALVVAAAAFVGTRGQVRGDVAPAPVLGAPSAPGEGREPSATPSSPASSAPSATSPEPSASAAASAPIPATSSRPVRPVGVTTTRPHASATATPSSTPQPPADPFGTSRE